MRAFAGIATAVDNPDEIKFKDLLPGGGVGLMEIVVMPYGMKMDFLGQEELELIF